MRGFGSADTSFRRVFILEQTRRQLLAVILPILCSCHSGDSCCLTVAFCNCNCSSSDRISASASSSVLTGYTSDSATDFGFGGQLIVGGGGKRSLVDQLYKHESGARFRTRSARSSFTEVVAIYFSCLTDS